MTFLVFLPAPLPRSRSADAVPRAVEYFAVVTVIPGGVAHAHARIIQRRRDSLRSGLGVVRVLGGDIVEQVG